MELKEVAKHSKYLGLPMVISQQKSESFRLIEDKINKRLGDSKFGTLSTAGKEVFIKSVLQALPVYAMSCYKLPKGTCDKLSKDILQFWWCSGKDKSSIVWVNKEKMRRDKADGGLGFRQLDIFNKALLMKQAWRIISNPGSLLARVLKARYFPNGSFCEAGSSPNASHAWKGIAETIPFLKRGIAEGSTLNGPRWLHSSSGTFTTSSAYKSLMESLVFSSSGQGSPSSQVESKAFWLKIWKVRLMSKIKIHVWRLFHDGLPTRANLRRRGCLSTAHCELCGFQLESSTHLFRDCWTAKAVWANLNLADTVYATNCENIADWLWSCVRSCSKDQLRLFLCALWLLWLERNAVIFKNKAWDATNISRSAKVFIINFDRASSSTISRRWEPQDNVFKIFCDGAWSQSEQRAGFGCVLAKDNIVLSIAAGQIPHAHSSFDTEGFALLKGMILALANGVQSAAFLSDSLEVVEAVTTGKMPSGPFRIWFCTIRGFLAKHKSWDVFHIPRELNVAADYLAKKAKEDSWSWSSKDSIPLPLPWRPA